MANPYRWSKVNLDLIFGRELLLAELLQQLPSHCGNSFGLTGARRMGKTTVLRAVERDLSAGGEIWSLNGTLLIPIYLDGLTFDRPLLADQLWHAIAIRIQQALKGEVWNFAQPVDFRRFVEGCASLFRRAELVPRVVVLIDEVEHILAYDWAPSFFANWRALLTNFPDISGFFGAVFSGARELEALQHDVGSPLMDVLEWRSLRSLSLEETSRLIREPCGLMVSDALIGEIFTATGGHPMIVQYVMQKALGGNDQITAVDVNAAIADFEATRSWQFSDWWSKYCAEEARLVYRSIPISGARMVRDIVKELGGFRAARAMENLEHVGISRASEDRTELMRLGAMFDRWQQRFGAFESDGDVDQELARQLGEVASELRDKYVSAWRIYSQHMPNYSGAVSEVRDLITLLLHRLAPDAEVEAQSNFSFEKDQTRPTRRQRVYFILGAGAKEQAKAVASDDTLLETLASQLASALANTYSNASSLTHTTATRPLAYRALKQAESIIAQLLAGPAR